MPVAEVIRNAWEKVVRVCGKPHHACHPSIQWRSTFAHHGRPFLVDDSSLSAFVLTVYGGLFRNLNVLREKTYSPSSSSYISKLYIGALEMEPHCCHH